MPNTSITKASPAQQGFTLIEIIAVLVILGILSAVAVPKFMDMRDEARQKGLESLVSAAQSNLHMAFARNLLTENGNQTAAFQNINSTVCNQISADGWLTDATIDCSDPSGENDITITAEYGDYNATGTFSNPVHNDDIGSSS
ncbi:prepilin-type N-terminal cleavage/methylation domain-containing protein [Desulfovermiculus halophilus]|jgi:MSHA pilin protein MshA|uniref:prepilin-type N-terminal cleavage/methylation domain-containing protein n=1 Tax=Desulfovermiculus halophilus TaxID=339722 RepID=UPI000A0362C2|nr:prepilin-type N-terminal cleavage/methylation domain-containing protein [Desulfovermiculus halophilus]